MLEHITGYDIAVEAEMVRTKFKGTILFLEGQKDILLLERFIDADGCYSILAHGKDNALAAIKILESRKLPGVIAIVDADHWHLVGRVSPSPNIMLTDLHDTELMIIQSNAFRRVIEEYGSSTKISKFLKHNLQSNLRELLLERCVPIGILRLISTKESLLLKFKGIKFKSFVDASSLSINITKMVNTVISNTARQGINPADLISMVNNEMIANTDDRCQLCCGHDITELIGIGLRKALGNQMEAIACRLNLESVLRLAYDMRDFIRTSLYNSIKAWESRNYPYIVFIPNNLP